MIVDELGHMTLAITRISKPSSAFGDGIPSHFTLQRGGFLFKDIVKKFFRGVWSVDFLGCFQQVERELMAVGLKKIVAPARQSIDHLGTTHFLRTTPGIEIAITLESQTMLLDAHVAHLHFVHQLVDGHSPRAFERINYFKSLSAANFRE